MQREILDVYAAARFLGYSVSTLRNWNRSGKLKARRFTTLRAQMYYYLDDLKAFRDQLNAVDKPPLQS